MKKDLKHKLINQEIMELVNYYLFNNSFNELLELEKKEIRLNDNEYLIVKKYYFIDEIYNQKIYVKTLQDLENNISSDLNFDKIFEAYEVLNEIRKNKNTSYLIKYKEGGYLKNESTGNYNSIFGYKDNEYCSHFYGVYGEVLYKIEKEINEDFAHNQADSREFNNFDLLKIIAKILEHFDIENEKEFNEKMKNKK